MKYYLLIPILLFSGLIFYSCEQPTDSSQVQSVTINTTGHIWAYLDISDGTSSITEVEALLNQVVSTGFEGIMISANTKDGKPTFSISENDMNPLRLAYDLSSSTNIEMGVMFDLGNGPGQLESMIRQIIEDFGPPDWIDFQNGDLAESVSLDVKNLIESLAPNCLIGSNIGWQNGSFSQIPESIESKGTFAQSWYRQEDLSESLMNDFIGTLSHGGAYRCRIVPEAEGSLSALHTETLGNLQTWMTLNHNILEGIGKDPIGGARSWGHITTGPNNQLHLHIFRVPENRSINIYGLANLVSTVQSTAGPSFQFQRSGNSMFVNLEPIATSSMVVPEVLTMTYQGPLDLIPIKRVYPDDKNVYKMTLMGADKTYVLSGSNRFNTIAQVKEYSWNVSLQRSGTLSLYAFYPSEEFDKDLTINVGEKSHNFTPEHTDVSEEFTDFGVIMGVVHTSEFFPNSNFDKIHGITAGINRSGLWGFEEERPWARDSIWGTNGSRNLDAAAHSVIYVLQNFFSPGGKDLYSRIGSEDGIQVWINGNEIAHMLTPDEEKPVQKLFELPTVNGNNQLLVKFYTEEGPSNLQLEHNFQKIIYEKKIAEIKVTDEMLNRPLKLSLSQGDGPIDLTVFRMQIR